MGPLLIVFVVALTWTQVIFKANKYPAAVMKVFQDAFAGKQVGISWQQGGKYTPSLVILRIPQAPAAGATAQLVNAPQVIQMQQMNYAQVPAVASTSPQALPMAIATAVPMTDTHSTMPVVA